MCTNDSLSFSLSLQNKFRGQLRSWLRLWLWSFHRSDQLACTGSRSFAVDNHLELYRKTSASAAPYGTWDSCSWRSSSKYTHNALSVRTWTRSFFHSDYTRCLPAAYGICSAEESSWSLQSSSEAVYKIKKLAFN